jgi:hypothetical protein
VKVKLSWSEAIEKATVILTSIKNSMIDPIMFEYMNGPTTRERLIEKAKRWNFPQKYLGILQVIEGNPAFQMKVELGIDDGGYVITHALTNFHKPYHNTSYTNAFEVDDLKIIATLNPARIIEMSVTPELNNISTSYIEVERMSQLDALFVKLKALEVPSTEQMSRGEKIPAVLVHMPCKIDTNIRVITNHSQIENKSVVINANTLIQNAREGICMDLNEDVMIYSNRSALSNTFINQKITMPMPKASPFMNVKRVSVKPIRQLKDETTTLLARKRELTIRNEIKFDRVTPEMGKKLFI